MRKTITEILRGVEFNAEKYESSDWVSLKISINDERNPDTIFFDIKINELEDISNLLLKIKKHLENQP